MSDLMTPEEIQAIRELEQAATKGPWESEQGCDNDGADINEWWVCQQQNPTIYCDTKTDADFIAAARQTIPSFLDHIAAQDKEIERLKAWEQENQNMLEGLPGDSKPKGRHSEEQR